MKKVLLYLALVVLFILLWLPMVLRIFVKDKEEEEKPKDVVQMLSCTKQNETVNMSYLNNKAYLLNYQIKGDFTSDNEDLDMDITKTLVPDLKKFATSNYNSTSNITTFSHNFEVNIPNQEDLINFSLGVQEERDYFSQLGFSCNISQL